jgi:hypothetical protein
LLRASWPPRVKLILDEQTATGAGPRGRQWFQGTPRSPDGAEGGDRGGANERTIGEHIRMAHATFKGEHQIAEYVARLEIEECVRILAVAPEGLPQLAALRDECRVGADERRSFEEVIRTWTEFVLSGVESG